MTDPVLRVARDTVDVTIGTVARLSRLTRRAAGEARAAPPARALLRVGRAVAWRLPWPGDAVRNEGRALRDRGRDGVRDVVRAQLDVLVPVVVDAVLDRVDLTGLVVRRVDLDRVVRELDIDAVVARADLDGVIARVDLLALAEFVVDGIDLPKIIRESTGSVASEGLRQVRLTSVEADRALAQFVDRMMFRRSARRDGHAPPGAAPVDGSRV